MSSPAPLVASSIARIEQLVPAPRSLARALRLLHDPQADLSDISELIALDSALAAAVLRTANSAYYAAPEPIASVNHAVQFIGFRETIRLVSAVAATQTTQRPLGSYGIAADDFWTESLISGLFLSELARHSGTINEDDAYSTGLLRLVGRLALNHVLIELGGGLFWNRQWPMAVWEKENFGASHSEIGGELLRRWQFPDDTCNAIALQELPALPTDASPLVSATHFAAHVLREGLGAENLLGATPPALIWIDHPFAREARLTPEVLTQLWQNSLSKLAAIVQQLRP